MAAAKPVHKILLFPGDGVGKEVVDEAAKCLRRLESALGTFVLEMVEVNWGVAHWKQTGRVAPVDFLDQCKRFDAVFLGALGAPGVLPDHLAGEPIIKLRQGLDMYINLRPVKLYPGVKSVLAGQQQIDLVVVRENSEGEYVGNGGNFKVGTTDEVATEVAIHTYKGVERVCRFAFELARSRNGKKRVTLATKSNALKFAMTMWDRVFAKVSADFPDIKADKCHVDALSMDFVRRPEQLDVVVGSNLFGDILSDLGGAIVGSLGLSPSANLNPEKVNPSMFEPVHGSAPDIAGKGIANPIGAIRTAGMLLEFFNEHKAASILDAAVAETLLSGKKTQDVGGSASTSEVGDDVIAHMKF
jgi:tartrate dehydrogenase/decarboxylase/D-malate dehydrogenase